MSYDYLDDLIDVYGDLPHTKAFVREKLLRVSETFSKKCQDRIYLEATYNLVCKAKMAETMYDLLMLVSHDSSMVTSTLVPVVEESADYYYGKGDKKDIIPACRLVSNLIEALTADGINMSSLWKDYGDSLVWKYETDRCGTEIVKVSYGDANTGELVLVRMYAFIDTRKVCEQPDVVFGTDVIATSKDMDTFIDKLRQLCPPPILKQRIPQLATTKVTVL